MRTIFARWSQACKGCGKPINVDQEIRYDDATKKAFHIGCEPAEQPDLLSQGEAERLADLLGFMKVTE